MREIPYKYRIFFIYLTLALVSIIVFWQLIRCDFIIYDDAVYVTGNPHVLSGFTLENIIWAFNNYDYASNWHPLTWLSHMLDCKLFGLAPSYHHLTNLLLHIANTLLLFAALKQMTSTIWRSAFVAALFAIHPLHVESVAWIAERKDVLSTFFWMLTMICYVQYVKRPSIASYLLTLLMFALGLMAKPMLVTLPFTLLLLDYWPLKRIENISFAEPPSRQNVFHLVYEKIPFFILSTASSIVTFLAQRSTAVVQIQKLPLTTRIANAIVSYLEYIEKMFWPARLAIFYPYSIDRLSVSKVTVSASLLIFVTILIIHLASKYRYLPVGWFWYLGTLVPVIGLVHVGLQARADRYTYVPLIGLFIIIAWGLPELFKHFRHRKILFTTSAFAVLSALSVCTWFQTGFWRNDVTLFEHAIKVTDNNYLAYSILGHSYHLQGKLDKALACNSMALQIKSDHVPAHNDLAQIFYQMGKLDEAVLHFKEILQIEPNTFDAHENIANIFSSQGKLAEAADHLDKAVKIDPRNAQLHCELGIVLGRQGKFEQAVAQFNEALQIKPHFAQAHSNLGYALLNQNKLDEAIAHLAHAVQLDPNSNKSHYYLAIALTEKGMLVEAVKHLECALHLEPNSVDTMNSLAWFLATHKEATFYNPKKAVELASNACELTSYSNAEMLDTLAAAYAAVGNFLDATTAAEKALKLAESSGNRQLADEIQKRLGFYKTGYPYIEPVQKQTAE